MLRLAQAELIAQIRSFALYELRSLMINVKEHERVVKDRQRAERELQRKAEVRLLTVQSTAVSRSNHHSQSITQPM